MRHAKELLLIADILQLSLHALRKSDALGLQSLRSAQASRISIAHNILMQAIAMLTPNVNFHFLREQADSV